MSQADLATRSGLSRVGYRNIETGEARPKANTLMRLARELGVGLEDLIRPTKKLSTVRFRADKHMNSRENILVEVGLWLEDYQYLESLQPDKQIFAFGDLAAALKVEDEYDAIGVALRARQAAGLGERVVIRDICGLLEDKGVKLFTPQVASEGFFGLSLGLDGDGPAVVVNTWERIPVERWIFTAAHELGHILMHQSAFDVQEEEENTTEEREADLFASHFLMPDNLFVDEWNEARGLSLVHAVLKLKAIFRVSWKSVVFRLSQHEGSKKHNIWARFYQEAKREFGKSIDPKKEIDGLSSRDWQSPSPALRIADELESLRKTSFVEDRQRRLVRAALETQAITLSRAAKILRISTREMRALTKSWLPD